METVSIGGRKYGVISANTVVLGAGAAALSAADRLHSYGQTDICIVCESLMQSTSRNTGSDKQTYYKLTLSGGDPDSVRELAQTLFAGGCVDGDIALCEAALSAPCFLRLADLGVPFPVNRYGEYIGYKTDHDPRRRATSAGPLTSKLMTECLERAVMRRNIAVYEGYQAVAVVKNVDSVCGLLCIHMGSDAQSEFVLFRCKNLLFATGGPAGMYAASVFPEGQFGATGLAFEAGVRGKNLTEWQFGLASVSPRWNVSGTYMQVLPRFISTDGSGGDEREFLNDFFTDAGELTEKVFLKGYEWPFDVRKVAHGSSIIDILVYIETCIKERRVFLDFRRNPGDRDITEQMLRPEVCDYLRKAGAIFGTPIERLMHMNLPAYEFYRDKGVDLQKEPLEIALCAQHNNGGLDIDCWWQTNVTGFFAAGEVSASHGVYRPGGSALNAGQVGSTRAAQYIARCRKGEPISMDEFAAAAQKAVAAAERLKETAAGDDTLTDIWINAQRRMSRVGGAIRDISGIKNAISEISEELSAFEQNVRIPAMSGIGMLFRLREMLICQKVYLTAMTEYVSSGGKSRGSALYTVADGDKPYDILPEMFRYKVDDGMLMSRAQCVDFDGEQPTVSWRDVRPIPEEDDFFENVWRGYRENGNVY